MTVKGLAYLFVVCSGGVASAGGLFLPGAGVISTSRAGAAVASAADAEAIALNPAGIAKATGAKVTIGIAAIDYLMSFQRAGTYDTIKQEAAIILPSLDIAYSITPDLDVGVRGSVGVAQLKSTVGVMGLLNEEEYINQDGSFSVDASAVVETGGLGVSDRRGPNIELGANYPLPIMIHAKGNAVAFNAPGVTLAGAPVSVVPADPDKVRCASGGTAASLKACAAIA